jgi:hypothetical protein
MPEPEKPWTAEEDELFYLLLLRRDTTWADCLAALPGHSESDLRNRYNWGSLVWDGQSYRYEISEVDAGRLYSSDYSDDDSVYPVASDEAIREMLLMVIPEAELDNPTWELPSGSGDSDDDERDPSYMAETPTNNVETSRTLQGSGFKEMDLKN